MIAGWMQVFVTVAEVGSFSTAAKSLGVGQSTISKQVAALEAHLAVRLFHRTTRSLSLTIEGAEFYEAAKQALAAIDEAVARVSDEPHASGLIRVTCPQSLAERKVAGMIASFLAEHPGTEIDLVVSDNMLNLVADNLDLAIRVGQLADSQLIGRRIGTARRVIAAAPAYLDRRGWFNAPADLAEHNCVLFSLLGSGNQWSFGDGTKVRVGGNMRANCPSTLRAAALAGLGVVQSALWLFEEDFETGRLIELFRDNPPEPMPIHAILPSGQYVSARVRHFLDHLAQEFSRDPLCMAAT